MISKRIYIVALLLIIGCSLLHAQKAETVSPLSKELHSLEWFKKQSSLWQRKISSSPRDAKAWENYYMAERMMKLIQDGEIKLKAANYDDLNNIVDRARKYISGTYEFYYISYLNAGTNFIDKNLLDKAYNLDPNRSEIIKGYICYYEFQRDTGEVAIYARKWYDSKDISPGILAYNYNLLMSLDSNAILFTSSDNDTYPIWLLQYAKDFRRDVTVINISLASKTSYIEEITKEKRLDGYKKGPYNFNNYKDYVADLIEHFAKVSKKKPVYVSATLPKSILKNFYSKLFIEGLAFRYSENSYRNYAVLKNNFEYRFITDYLKVGMQNDPSQSVLDKLNYNYLFPMIKLYELYGKSNSRMQAANLRDMILNIAGRSGFKNEIASILSTLDN